MVRARRHAAGSTRRPGRAGERCTGAMRWWGWGEDGHDAGACPSTRSRCLRDEVGLDAGAPARRRWRSRRCACRDPRCRRRRARAAGGGRRRGARARRPRRARACTPRGKQLSRPRAPARGRLPRRAGRRRRARLDHERGARGPRRLRGGAAWRSCRSAAARASSAASSRCADGFAARDLARPAPPRPAARRRRALADGDARGRAARARGRARSSRPSGLHARPLPAELRVRDDRRLRGHALGRAGLDGLRAHRRARRAGCGWRRRPASSTLRALPGQRRGPGRCASWSSARRACSGVITRGHAARAPAPAEHAPLRGLVVPRPSPRASRRCARSSRRTRRPTWRGCPTRRRRGCRSRWPATGGAAERVGRAYLRAARATRAAAWRSSAGRATTTTSSARRLHASALLRAGGGLALGQRPGRRGLRGRFDGPYLRDDLLDRGVMVETLETATTWSNLPTLYAAVGDAQNQPFFSASAYSLLPG